MKTSIEIGRVIGIPIKIHITFLLILPLFILLFAENKPPIGFVDLDPPLKYVFASIAAITLFLCVVLHELSHSYVAMRYGTKINSITLFIFGGIASMEEIPREPEIESKVAVAGPGMSFLIGFSSFVLYFLFKGDVKLLFLNIGYINVSLALFNLIPAFPMDGGRILRAYFAKKGSYIAATQKAAYIGKMFAIIMGIFGFFAIAQGGMWLILIAFFIYIAASEEETATVIQFALEGIKVRDIMTRDVISVSSDMSINEVIDLMFREKHMGYPVVNDEIKGIVTFSDISKIPFEERKSFRVGDILSSPVITVSPEDDATKALKIMLERNIGRLIVEEDGRMVGILSRTDLMRTIELLKSRI
ncbi:MAG: CBS domain-containing protein [Candidatus Syntropharchaeia archaeon]